jgi:hypothetical protein
MQGKSVLIGVAACAAFTCTAGAQPTRAANTNLERQDKTPPTVVFSRPEAADLVHIDGSKNPEMIPQWNAWESAFGIVALVSDIPTDVAVHLTKEEQAALVAAAKEARDNRRATERRVLELVPLLQTQEAKSINDKTQEITLEYRQQTLRLRDRVLAALGPEGQAALNQWVESTKSGMRISIPKAELEFYRRPQ